MSLPCRLQLFDRLCKRLIRISKVYGGFVLAAIGMQRIPVGESMRIVIAHDRCPVADTQDFKLDSELSQSAAAAAE